MLVLYHRRILKDDQSMSVLSRQRYWAEKLVDHLFRYQSPQTSCPEISHLVIRNHLSKIYDGFIDLAHKVWLRNKFKDGKKVRGVFANGRNFGVMLKSMFVFQKLHDRWSINKFYWDVKGLRCEIKDSFDHNSSYDPLIGFEYDQTCRYGVYDISVGLHLSSFFHCLNSNMVIDAISHAVIFIRYSLDHIHQVYLMNTPGSLDDLTSLIEFMTSLIFATNSIDLSEQLLNKLDFTKNTKNYHSPIILRLLRLLVLIGWNEYIFTLRIGKIFESLNHHISAYSEKVYEEKVSEKIKRYLKER
ncbi:1970_t:CDS:2, partial [Racocetra fulgida]